MFGFSALTFYTAFLVMYKVRFTVSGQRDTVTGQRWSAFTVETNDRNVDLNNYIPKHVCVNLRYPNESKLYSDSLKIMPKRNTGCFILYHEHNCQGPRLKFLNVNRKRSLTVFHHKNGKETLMNFQIAPSSVSSCPPASQFIASHAIENRYFLYIENTRVPITEKCSNVSTDVPEDHLWTAVNLQTISYYPQICIEIYFKEGCIGELIQFIVEQPLTKTDMKTFRGHIRLWLTVKFGRPENDVRSVKKCPLITTNLDLGASKSNGSYSSTRAPKVTYEIIQTRNNPTDTRTMENSTTTLWKHIAIIIVALFLSLLLARLTYIELRKCNSPRLQILTRKEISEFRHGIPDTNFTNLHDGDLFNVNETAIRKPYNRLLEIPKHNIEILSNQVLGSGEFGCVFKAVVQFESENTKEVALKISKSNGGATALKSFLSEIKILSYLGLHPNIVPILGAYTAEIHKGTVYIATELCPLGSLRGCLKGYQDDINSSTKLQVPFDKMIRWSYEIACGMEYLERKSVIHADLATRNVLLTSESIAKISDFGLSRRLYMYTNYTKTSKEPLPWRWMAYESLKKMEFSTKSDVWSFGVTLWEIFSLGCQPYLGYGWAVDFVEKLEEGFRLKRPRYATPDVFEVIEKCWNLDNNERPSFVELKDATSEIHNKALNGLYFGQSVWECPEDTNSANANTYSG